VDVAFSKNVIFLPLKNPNIVLNISNFNHQLFSTTAPVSTFMSRMKTNFTKLFKLLGGSGSETMLKKKKKIHNLKIINRPSNNSSLNGRIKQAN
jgi:hypothetical protein